MQQDPSDRNRPLQAPSELRYRYRLWGTYLTGWHHIQVPSSTSERYREVLQDFGGFQLRSLVKLLFRLLRLLFPGFFFRSELIVDDRSAAAPWEAILSPHPMPIVLRRVTREWRQRTLPEWQSPVEVLTWSGSVIHTMRNDWSVHFRATFASNEEQYSEANPKVGVLRILATPVQSNSGLALRIRSDDPSETPYTVRGAELLSRYPALRLCILQCPPAEVGRRLSGDRRNAALLKRIGAEIFSSGVPVVIVVPVLPERASSQLAESVFSVLGRQPANAVPLLEEVIASFRRTRDLLSLAEIPEDAEEIMQDVCLYAVPRVSLS